MSRTINLFQVVLLCLHFRPSFSVDQNVLQLTDQNLQKHLKRNEHLLVMFFIPWSGHCQKVRPHYAQAAKYITDNELPVALGKMDCSGGGRYTCESKNFGVQFPILHLYRKGEFVKEYGGSMDARNIVKFMRVQVLPSPFELKGVDEFKSFLKKQDDVVVVGFFDEDTSLKRMYFRVVEELKESIIFAYSTCEKLLMKEGVLNGIVLYKPESFRNNYEPERVLFTGRIVIGEIKIFITKNYHGLVGHRTPKNKNDFPNPLVVLYYTIDHHNQGQELNYWKNRVISVAHKHRKGVKVALSAKDEFDDELFGFDVDYADPMKPFVLGRDLENKKYLMTANFSSENFDNFIKNFNEHKLTPYVKSKPVPLENEEDIIIAVASNFEEIILNSSKDVLLDLYDPDSLKCQKFNPVFREVANLLQDEDILVAKYDTTKNEIPPVLSGKSIPNVYWMPKEERDKLVLYSGPRTVHDVIKFVAKHASKPLLHYDASGRPHVKEEL